MDNGLVRASTVGMSLLKTRLKESGICFDPCDLRSAALFYLDYSLQDIIISMDIRVPIFLSRDSKMSVLVLVDKDNERKKSVYVKRVDRAEAGDLYIMELFQKDIPDIRDAFREFIKGTDILRIISAVEQD